MSRASEGLTISDAVAVLSSMPPCHWHPAPSFAGYAIVRLGSGGISEVYLAQHPRLPRRDALKVLPDAMTPNSNFREGFAREADAAARL